MAFLFVVENSVAKPNTETLLISPFKDIWERDKTKSKEKAIKEFTFIEFMTSKRKENPYAGYSDEVRFEKLKELLFKEDWKMDRQVEDALIKMKEFQEEASPTYQYYIAVLKAAEQMKKFFNTLDISTVNEKTGNPLYKPRDITSAIKDTNNVLQELTDMKDKVEKELFEAVKTQGNKEINIFEQ